MNKDKNFLLYFVEKQLENVEHLKYLGSLINAARRKSEIRSSITMVKAAFYETKTLFTIKVKGKAIPLQAWTVSEGSRRLRLQDFKTIGT